MRYVCFNEKGEAIGVTDKSPFTGTPQLDLSHCHVGTVKVESSWDWKSFAEVAKIVSDLSRATGEIYLPCDAGDSVSPRYGIVKPPKIGDEVSYSFNGDTTPCGVVVRVTPSWTIVTSEGKRFKRVRQTSGWRMTGGTWWLVHGHITERNPHI